MNINSPNTSNRRRSADPSDLDYDGPFVVGKDILELLSSSMYVNPLAIYREYVQNAVDSIDLAIETGKLTSAAEGRVDIVLDHIERRAVIRDNGAGLSEDEFAQRMTSFGASHKRGTSARGFRGVGRLAGIGYCQELLFRSRSEQGANALEVRWDCKALKKLLVAPEFEGDLEELVRQIVSVRKVDAGGYPDRFFEVEIVKPRRIGNDRLLNELAINSYLSQVGPCPFDPRFQFAAEIREILNPLGRDTREYGIFLNESSAPIYRPYSNKIEYSETRVGVPTKVDAISIDAIDGTQAAVGWLLHHDYQGAIPTVLGVRGLRARVGNIQVGNERIFLGAFPEERFCSWTMGEVHLVDRRILPNGRRDDFEPNSHLANIVTHLTPIGSDVARHCRNSSQVRNRMKTFELGEQKIMHKLSILEQSAISKTATKSLKREVGSLLSEIKQAATFDLFQDQEKADLDVRTAELEKLVDDASKRSGHDDPLLTLPSNKRRTYREVIDLIYECSTNTVAAKSLVDRILSRVSKS